MFESSELKTLIEKFSTLKSRGIVLMEWNLNVSSNISAVGNYRYRPTESTSVYKGLTQSYDINDTGKFYTDATDADIIIDGGGELQGNATGLSGTPSINVGAINATSLSVSGSKSFDIPHPTKDGWRLKYICLEGPSADVYIRGKLEDSNVIELPDYWSELVDQETIMVNLTPFGLYQELFVEKIEWGSRIIVKNNLGGPINCSYVVYAERKDVDRNQTEYQA